MKSQKIAILEKARITFYSSWIYTDTTSSSSVKGTGIRTQRKDAQKIDRTGLSSWFSAQLVVMTVRNNFCVLICHRPLIRSSSHGWQSINLENLLSNVSIRFYPRRNEQNSRISRRIFEERCGSKVKLERRLPFLPSSTIDGGSIRAFRRSNQVTRCNLCKKIYAWTVRILVRRVTGRRD